MKEDHDCEVCQACAKHGITDEHHIETLHGLALKQDEMNELYQAAVDGGLPLETVDIVMDTVFPEKPDFMSMN